MKPLSSIFSIGALLAFAGSIVAAPVPDAAPVPAKQTEYVWYTVYHTKVVGVTKTEWVNPPTTTISRSKPTTTTTTTTTTDEETTTETTISPTTTSTTTSTTESTTEYPTTSTTTTTSSTTTSTTTTPTPTSTTTTSTTTTEETTSTTDIPTLTLPTPTPDIEVEVVTPKALPTPSPKPQSLSGGGWEGDATYFDPGMGSCGITSGPSDMIAAISYQVMDPKNPGNPNNNPLCGKKIRCTRGGKNPTIITVVDRCPVCKSGDLDLSPAAYAALGGTVAEGRFTIQCNWV